MPRIKILPEDVANKIAAGEVVERPASVVKELVENALDAGAGRIDVSVVAGGRRLVSVADDGCGMGREDAMLAPERQATSKLRSADDLSKIATMGFRGEALPSIASVSRFVLKTRRAADDAGTEVLIDGGTLRDVRECGMAPGTVVEVRDLFYNLPARRAFLRAFATEQAHVRSMVLVHAIAWPEVAFRLVCDGAASLRVAPAATREDRLRDLFGAGYLDAFVPVAGAEGDVRVSGWAGVPANTRGDTAGQFVFVNGRPATAPVVQAAVREAYPRLEAGRRPVVFLFIDLPPEAVDVNVHPTKREVRFRAASVVRDAVLSALARALRTSPGASWPGASGGTCGAGGSGEAEDRLRGFDPFAGTTPPPMPPLAPAPVQTRLDPIDEHTFDPRSPFPGIAGPAAGPAGPALRDRTGATGATGEGTGATGATGEGTGGPALRFRLVGVLSSGDAVVETEGGYAVVDVSSAHERVVYERLLRSAAFAESPAQALLLPQTVALGPVEAERVRSFLPVFSDMGFDIEDFGGDTFLVRSLPESLQNVPAKTLLQDTASAIAEAGREKARAHWREELVAAAAARAAVRAGKRLDERELSPLLLELAACRLPYVSPSGRPTMLFTSSRELDRRFGRA